MASKNSVKAAAFLSGKVPEAPFWLLAGEEGYFIREAEQALVDASLPPEDRAMNLKRYAKGELKHFAELLDAARTPSMFAQRRVFVVEVEARFKDFDPAPLEKSFASPPEGSCVIFIWPKPDKRKVLWKFLEKNMRLVDCSALSEKDSRTWVQTRAKRENVPVAAEAVNLLVERAGDSLLALSQELEKVFLYTDGKKVTRADVEATLSAARSIAWYELSDALGSQDTKRAFTVVHRLLERGESHIGLLVMLSNHFRRLLGVRSLREQGVPEREVASTLKLHPFYAKKLCEQAGRFPSGRLESALSWCAEADRTMKTSRISSQVVLDTLIIKISSRDSAL